MRAAVAAAGLAWAAYTSPQALADPPPAPDSGYERLVFSTDGSTLSGGEHGGGASGTWLHAFSANAVLGLGAEYQQIADANWSAGLLSGSVGLGHSPERPHAYGEIHAGAGTIGTRDFHYWLLTAGILATLTPRLAAQFEERRIDIDTSHGNLPKVGLSLRATPNLSVGASYARSVGGNLATRLTTVRCDYSDSSLTGMAGVVWGPATPAVFDLSRQNVTPGASLTEGFAGIGRTMRRTAWLLVADYQNVAGSARTTVTVTYAFTLHAAGQLR